ncbi:hypothetical protein FRB98_007147 [Tulasnella sp. 332]|nr:hypothetical protein FRB98_007147 [Tulasnella sp. 332]
MLPKTTIPIEPIYTDHHGQPLPKVKEILPDVSHTYQNPFNSATKLRKNLRRIQDKYSELRNLQVSSLYDEETSAPAETSETAPKSEEPHVAEDTASKPFTPTDLEALRHSVVEKLYWADLEVDSILLVLHFLFTTVDSTYVPHPEVIPPGFLTTTDVVPFSSSLPAGLPSVQAINSQIIVGTKDQTLRRASTIFQAAAARAEKVVEQAAGYWETAVELRRRNWPLVAAPLRDLSNMAGHRGALIGEAYAKDFRVAYGLESEQLAFQFDVKPMVISANPKIRKLATATIRNQKEGSNVDNQEVLKINGPTRRLRVGLTTTGEDDTKHIGYTDIPKRHDVSRGLSEIDEELVWAQAASVEEEIFSEISKEVAHLPSASARISEKKMCIDAAVDAVLTLEMIDTDDIDALQPLESSDASASRNSAIAGLILGTFSILLVRSHRVLHRAQSLRSDATGMIAHHGPQLAAYMAMRPILAPVVSLLQYRSVVTHMRRTLGNLSSELIKVGIPCEAELRAVGDDVREVLVRGALMSEFDVTGQPAAGVSDFIPTLESSISMLTSEREELLRFLIAEVSRCVMERLKEVGMATESANVTRPGGSNTTRWIVDGLEGTLVGDRVGGRIQVKIIFSEEFKITALAIKTTANMHDGQLADPTVHEYPPQPLAEETNPQTSLEDWVKEII